MINKNIFRSLLIVASLAFLYACSSPLAPNDALKKYAGTWKSEKGGTLFEIDGSGSISSTHFSGGTLESLDNSGRLFKITDTISHTLKGNVTLIFTSDTQALMYLDFGTFQKEYSATKQ